MFVYKSNTVQIKSRVTQKLDGWLPCKSHTADLLFVRKTLFHMTFATKPTVGWAVELSITHSTAISFTITNKQCMPYQMLIICKIS